MVLAVCCVGGCVGCVLRAILASQPAPRFAQADNPPFFLAHWQPGEKQVLRIWRKRPRIHPTRKFIRPFLDHFIRPILDRLFDRFSAVLSDRSSTVYSTVSRPFYSTVLFDRLPTVHLFDRFLRSQVFTDLAPAPSSTRPTAQRLPNKDQPRRHCSYAPPPQPPPPPWPHATHTTHTPADTRPAAPSCRPPRGAGFWRGG